jgi:uncharacterized membrane protein YeaQ/YmgE (transglycosylase-associated protein family)
MPPRPRSFVSAPTLQSLTFARVHGSEVTMNILLLLLLGLSVGMLARMILPGNAPGGWVVSMVLGAGGAVLGARFGLVVGLYREGQAAGLVAAVAGAIALLGVYHAVTSRRSRWI